MNLVATFLETARRRGAHPAIVSGRGESISFAALAERSGRLAAGWEAAGIKADDRVLLAMPVGIDLYAAIAALWRLGAVIVFPEPAMGLAGIRRALEIVRPDALLVSGIYRILPLLVPKLFGLKRLRLDESRVGDTVATLAAEHPALLSFTSGSTGRPKAIVRSHGFLAAQNAALHGLIAPRHEHEVDLVAFPVFVIANLSLGTTSVLPGWRMTRPDRAGAATIFRQVEAHRVTRALVPPSVCEVLAGSAEAPPLEVIFTGGGPVFPDLLDRLAARLPRAEIVAVYGSTEAEPIAHLPAAAISAEEWVRMRRGGGILAGRPIDGLQLRIIDDEIVVSGPHVNKGYLGGIGDAENKLQLDGEIWHRTGDAGTLDAEGKLWLHGRRAARVGAIYPFDVEAPARMWPGVRRAALLPELVPPTIVLDGVEPTPGLWQSQASALGELRVVNGSVPLDRRHRAKIDYTALRRAFKDHY